jgi:hypothetical protein
VCERREELALALVRARQVGGQQAQLLLGVLAFGDVATLGGDAGDVSAGITDRLVDEVEEALLQRRGTWGICC